MLGLDARPLLRCWSNEARALRPARDGGEARPARAAAPERGRAAVHDHGGTVAGLIQVDRFEVPTHVEPEPIRCELRGLWPGGHTLEVRLPNAVLKRSVLIGKPWPERPSTATRCPCVSKPLPAPCPA